MNKEKLTHLYTLGVSVSSDILVLTYQNSQNLIPNSLRCNVLWHDSERIPKGATSKSFSQFSVVGTDFTS